MKLTLILLLFFAGIAGSTSVHSHLYAEAKTFKRVEANQSAMVFDYSTNSTTFERNADRPRSIASITKIMTAMVVLDTLPDLHKKIKLKTAYLGHKEYTLKSMLDLLLVRSDNNIAEILSRNFHSNRNSFIRAMNAKARELGMYTAKFVDPSGLNPGNKASARDVAKMMLASAAYPAIRETAKSTMDFDAFTKKGHRTIVLPNTNYRILNEFDNIVVSKTGTTNAAGKCLGMVVEKEGRTYVVVIMGEPNSLQRDSEARTLLHHLVN